MPNPGPAQDASAPAVLGPDGKVSKDSPVMFPPEGARLVTNPPSRHETRMPPCPSGLNECR
jgi:hypothetical protein